LLPEDVSVPGVLPDDVHVDPAQTHLAQLVVRHRLVQREARRDPPGCRAGAVELGDDPGDGLAGSGDPAQGGDRRGRVAPG